MMGVYRERTGPAAGGRRADCTEAIGARQDSAGQPACHPLPKPLALAP